MRCSTSSEAGPALNAYPVEPTNRPRPVASSKAGPARAARLEGAATKVGGRSGGVRSHILQSAVCDQQQCLLAAAFAPSVLLNYCSVRTLIFGDLNLAHCQCLFSGGSCFFEPTAGVLKSSASACAPAAHKTHPCTRKAGARQSPKNCAAVL